MRPSGYGAYQRVQAETSSSGELVLMLYDALLKHLHRAHEALEAREGEAAHHALLRSQDIVLELIASLDMEVEIAKQLAPLYEYQYQRLLQANVSKDAGPVTEVIRLIEPLRDAWAHAVRAASGAPARQAGARDA